MVYASEDEFELFSSTNTQMYFFLYSYSNTQVFPKNRDCVCSNLYEGCSMYFLLNSHEQKIFFSSSSA